MKRVFLCLSLLIINYGILFAEEQITITTYYPSPHGSYDELTANKMKIGSTYSLPATAFINDGLLVQGNVGIATTGPLAKLAVVGQGTFGTSAFTPPGSEPLSTIGTGSGISMNDRDGVSPRRVIYPSGDILRFWRNGTGDQMVITGAGNVGVGTSAPGYKLEVAGDIYANDGWLRTGGATGWYNQDFGGGWNMSDSTWIRSYGSKNVYSDSVIRADGGFQVDGNQVIDADAGWHRTYGATGWYNGTYGGGWYMADPTWIRSYGSKSVYIDRTLEVGTASSNTTNLTVHGQALIFNDIVNAAAHDVLFLADYNDNVDLYVNADLIGFWSVPRGNHVSVRGEAFIPDSDVRLKKDIKTLTGVLDKLTAFRGVSFNWRDENRPAIGVIAQEVETVFPELVYTDKIDKGKIPGLKGVNSEALTAVVLQGLKELKEEVRAQADTIRSQAKEITALKQRLK